jgi:hypothetical protein
MTKKAATTHKPWPNIQGLIECGGNISIGEISPIPCAAVAADEHNMLAALRRRDNEDLIALLDRLDAAIEKAVEDEIFTDEING